MTNDKLKELIQAGNFTELKSALKSGEIVKSDGKLYLKEDYDKIKYAESQSALYDILQGVRKVNL